MPTALIIVDVQRDFCAGGALEVADGDAVVPVINRLRETLRPDLVVLTQDWHPADHTSFVTNNSGARLFEARPDGQMMWPVHCVQDSEGASWHAGLVVKSTDQVFRKGLNAAVDSYSGFGSEPAADGSRKELTDLGPALQRAGITDVVVVGLAFDYCVAATAKDAAALGFRTTVIRGATRAVAAESAARVEIELSATGVMVLDVIPAAGATIADLHRQFLEVHPAGDEEKWVVFLAAAADYLARKADLTPEAIAMFRRAVPTAEAYYGLVTRTIKKLA